MAYEFEVEGNKFFFSSESLLLYKDYVNNDAQPAKRKAIQSQTLRKAIINVANVCNGGCIYCYENGGNFGQVDMLMNQENADKVVSYLCDNFSHIHIMEFFGGEPTLNFKIIQYIVEKIEKKCDVDQYEMVTNAVNLTDEILYYFNQHSFKLIVSIDGPAYIHDKLRLKCSHKVVESNIKKIKKLEIGNKLELNCTYSKYHQKNISKEELIDYFEKMEVKYHLSNIITDIDWLQLPEKNISEQEAEIDESLENLRLDVQNVPISKYVKDVIQGVVEKEYKEMFCYELCNGYLVAFDCKGDRYPCEAFMYKYKIGSKEIELCNSKNNENCKQCWARGLCSHCVADIVLKRALIPYQEKECPKRKLYGYALEKLMQYYQRNINEFQDIIDNYYK